MATITKARLVNNQAVDVTTGDPTEMFHPDIAAEFVTVPNGTLNGATKSGNTWTPPTPAASTPVTVYPTPSVPQFMLLLSSAERVALRAKLADDPVLADFFKILDDSRTTEVDMNIASIRGAIEYALNVAGPVMVPAYDTTAITGRMAAILSGVPL